MKFLEKFLGDDGKRLTRRFYPLIEKINELEKQYEKLSDEELKAKTDDFKILAASSQTPDAILPNAFAVVREVSKRVSEQRHFDVQLMGGVALHEGAVVEMRTGEGKTLAATLPAYLNALGGESVHIITVNDYLARRDNVWMGPIYHALGLTVSCINHQDQSYLYDPSHKKNLDAVRDTTGAFHVVHEFLRPCSRQEAYRANIIYGTNNEFGFDYLRDNLVYNHQEKRQNGHHFAIVDEVDSILIDEARTPLIISAPDEESADLYKTFANIAPRLKAEEHYTVDEKRRAVSITDSGIEKVERALGIKNLYTEGRIKYVHHLEQALRAQVLFVRDKEYVVSPSADGNEIIIVDEFTGRLMPGRRWSDGLHQAIEAKEKVPIQRESRTYASITFQNYFRMYKKLSGMTGTAVTSKEEFHKVYNLDVVVIPTHKPMIRIDNSDKIFQTEKGKWEAVIQTIKNLHEKRQPVLVGTVSIEKNEKLSALLSREGVPHEILNAKNHEREGEIIAQAGKPGTVTIATNMAGRGVDIVLGGKPPSPREADEVRKAGGLFVLGTERHEARRIDNQLRGRGGRQGDPGESVFYVSLEDNLMRIFASDRIKTLMGTFGIPEDQPIENKMVSKALESAQAKIEGFNFDARKHLLEFDDVMNRQRTKIYNERNEILTADAPWLRGKIKDVLENREQETVDGKQFVPDSITDWESVRRIFLQTMDLLWVEHLETMEYMRSSVNLRAYGQRDPLVEYKNEGARLFSQFHANWEEMTAQLLLRGISNDQLSIYKQTSNFNVQNGKKIENLKLKIENSSSFISGKTGRNDPCPCGATYPDGKRKKYKHCHGK